MPKPSHTKPDNQLTEDQIDQIVRLRLDAVPVLQVAAEVGCNKNTVTKHFNRWLDETSVERRDELERERSRVITRLVAIADDARRQTLRTRNASGDDVKDSERWSAESKFMTVERQALRDLSTVAGLDAPKRIEVGQMRQPMSEEEAQAIIAEMGG